MSVSVVRGHKRSWMMIRSRRPSYLYVHDPSAGASRKGFTSRTCMGLCPGSIQLREVPVVSLVLLWVTGEMLVDSTYMLGDIGSIGCLVESLSRMWG